MFHLSKLTAYKQWSVTSLNPSTWSNPPYVPPSHAHAVKWNWDTDHALVTTPQCRSRMLKIVHISFAAYWQWVDFIINSNLDMCSWWLYKRFAVVILILNSPGFFQTILWELQPLTFTGLWRRQTWMCTLRNNSERTTNVVQSKIDAYV